MAEPLVSTRLTTFEQLVACRNGVRMTTAGFDLLWTLGARPPPEPAVSMKCEFGLSRRQSNRVMSISRVMPISYHRSSDV